MQKISTNIKKLKKSPLFALTLGGKELSHSNFWAWLIEMRVGSKNPFIEVFIQDFFKNNYIFKDVKREEGNRDLTIYYVDDMGMEYCYFIENKLKSIASTEQLEKYISKFNNKKVKFKGGILTGIKQTVSHEEWEFLSYKEISKRLINILENIEICSYYGELIREYAKDIDCISNIIIEKLKYKDKIYDYQSDLQLEKIRFNDVYLKYIGCSLSQYIEDNMDDCFKSKWGPPIISNSFNHKKPTIDIFYKQYGKDNTELGILGIQIEGNQFRLHGGPNHKNKIYKTKDSFFDKMCNLEYFSPYNNDKLFMGRETSMSKEYCSYTDKNGGFHLYQYWCLNNNLSFDDLLIEVKNELIKAKNIIDSGFTY